MPAFIKTPKDEEVWKRAKDRAHDQYGPAENDGFWAVVNHLYHKMRGKKAGEHLDLLADQLESYGLTKTATMLDAVSNTLHQAAVSSWVPGAAKECLALLMKSEDRFFKTMFESILSAIDNAEKQGEKFNPRAKGVDLVMKGWKPFSSEDVHVFGYLNPDTHGVLDHKTSDTDIPIGMTNNDNFFSQDPNGESTNRKPLIGIGLYPAMHLAAEKALQSYSGGLATSRIPMAMQLVATGLFGTISHELTHAAQFLDKNQNKELLEVSKRRESDGFSRKLYRGEGSEIEAEAVRNSVHAFLHRMIDGRHTPGYVDTYALPQDIWQTLFADWSKHTEDDLKDVMFTGKKLESEGLMTSKMVQAFKWYLGKMASKLGKDAIRGWAPTATFIAGLGKHS